MNAIEKHLEKLTGKKVTVFHRASNGQIEEVASEILRHKDNWYFVSRDKFSDVRFQWTSISLVFDNNIYLRTKVYGA